jgi:hypothetical protein
MSEIRLDAFIPVVKPEIAASLQRDLLDKFDEPYLIEQLKQLDEDNPVLSRFIRQFSKKTEDSLGAAWCAMVVVKLLQSQAEVNRMEMEINLD